MIKSNLFTMLIGFLCMPLFGMMEMPYVVIINNMKNDVIGIRYTKNEQLMLDKVGINDKKVFWLDGKTLYNFYIQDSYIGSILEYSGIYVIESQLIKYDNQIPVPGMIPFAKIYYTLSRQEINKSLCANIYRNHCNSVLSTIWEEPGYGFIMLDKIDNNDEINAFFKDWSLDNKKPK